MLITGSSGFIGSVTAEKALKRGWDVTGVDDERYGHHHVLGLSSVKKDAAEISKALFGLIPKVVIHLAAQSYIEIAEREPIETFRANTISTAEVAAYCARINAKLIFASSAGVYGSPVTLPMDENHPKWPLNVYSKLKMWEEDIVAWSGCRHTIFRFFNVAGSHAGFGERKDVEHILPRIFAAAKAGKEFVINGEDFDTPDGTPLRDYVHVSDIADALLKAAEEEYTNEVFNLGTGKGSSVKQLVQETQSFLADRGHELTYSIGPRRQGDMPALVCDASKAQKRMGWYPQKSLREIIADAWEVA